MLVADKEILSNPQMVNVSSPDNSFGGVDIMGSWVEFGMVMVALVAGMVIAFPVIKSFIIKSTQKRWNPLSETFREENQKIQDVLAEIRLKLNTGRTCLLQFHNGGTYLDGSGIKKFSLTHESCESGVSETSRDRHDVLMTHYLDMLSVISEKDSSPRLVSDLDDNIFRRHLESVGTTIFSIYPVTSLGSSRVVGMILAEWTEWEKIENVNDEDITSIIIDGSRRIEPHLQKKG